MTDHIETVGEIATSRHSAVRYRIGADCGDTFGTDSDYDGLSLTLEIADHADAMAMLAAITGPQTTMSAAALDVIAERVRQAEKEGWSHKHDDQHDDFSLAKAASVYAACASVGRSDRAVMDIHGLHGTPGKLQDLWPISWDISWLKPTNRRRDLIKAAALIIAEIERLDRAALSSSEGSDNE